MSLLYSCTTCKQFFASDESLNRHLISDHKKLMLQVLKSIPPNVLEDFIVSCGPKPVQASLNQTVLLPTTIKEELVDEEPVEERAEEAEKLQDSLLYICHVCNSTYTNSNQMVACIQSHSTPISQEIQSTSVAEVVIPVSSTGLDEVKDEPIDTIYPRKRSESPEIFKDDPSISSASIKFEPLDEAQNTPAIEQIKENLFVEPIKVDEIINEPKEPVERKVDKRFICDICGKTLKQKKDILRHCLRHLQKLSSEKANPSPTSPIAQGFTCDLCGVTIKHRYSFIKHFTKAHLTNFDTKIDSPQNKVACSVCGGLYVKSSLRKHMQRLHSGDTSIACEYCGKRLKNTRTYKEHVDKLHNQDSKVNCPVCTKKCANKGALTIHLKKQHNMKTKSDGQTTNEEADNHVCEVCGFISASKYSLECHYKRKHTQLIPRFECSLCPKTFRFKEDLKVHLKIHESKSIHKCPECNKEFNQKRYLLDHIRFIHSEPKTYTCQDCSKEFTKLMSYNRHRRDKHLYVKGKKTCKDCGAEYKNLSSLKKHLKNSVCGKDLTEQK